MSCSLLASFSSRLASSTSCSVSRADLLSSSAAAAFVLFPETYSGCRQVIRSAGWPSLWFQTAWHCAPRETVAFSCSAVSLQFSSFDLAVEIPIVAAQHVQLFSRREQIGVFVGQFLGMNIQVFSSALPLAAPVAKLFFQLGNLHVSGMKLALGILVPGGLSFQLGFQFIDQRIPRFDSRTGVSRCGACWVFAASCAFSSSRSAECVRAEHRQVWVPVPAIYSVRRAGPPAR